MKTAFKLLLLSASFLSANAFAKSEWIPVKIQPGRGESPSTLSNFVVTSEGTIYVTESFPAYHLIWKSIDGGVNWFTLQPSK
jgi:hypothetical protein